MTIHNHTSKTDSKNSSKIQVVLVHAEWCGVCKNLKPHWKQFENHIKNNPLIEIKKIEDTVYKDEIKKLEEETNKKILVNGFPTIFIIKDGNVDYFNGERTKAGLVSWVQMHGGDVGMNGGGKRRGRRSLRCRKTRSRSTRSIKK